MTFTSASIEVAFLWNMEHGLLGQVVQQYLADHPDHEDALLRVFRLGGNDLVKDLIERGADVTAFQSADVVPLTLAAEPEPEPVAPLSIDEQLLICQLREGRTDEAAELLVKLLAAEPPPKPTWRDQVKNADHYLMAFGIAGALVRNGLVDVDRFDVKWYRTFEHIVSTVEDALNALDN